jgi:hypothetical protein
MHIVIQENHYGEEGGGYVVSKVFGPYRQDEAEAIAERLNALDIYATEFSVHQLSLDTGIYK